MWFGADAMPCGNGGISYAQFSDAQFGTNMVWKAGGHKVLLSVSDKCCCIL